MAASDATPFPIKNQAYRVIFPILDADGDLVSGAASLDSEVSKDCGTFTDCTNEATEIATSSGMYYLDLSSDEINADVVTLIVKTTTSGAKTTPIVLYPVENTDIPVNVKAISDDTTAPDNLEADYDGTGYTKATSTIGTCTTNTDMISAATVNAQVVDVLKTDTTAEPSQGAPPATPTMEEMQAYIYFKMRNKGETTSTEDAMFASDGTTKIMKSTIGDNGTTFTKATYVSGA